MCTRKTFLPFLPVLWLGTRVCYTMDLVPTYAPSLPLVLVAHALTLSSCTCSSSLVTGNRHSSPTLCSHISLPVTCPYLSLMWKIQVAFSAMMPSLTPSSSNYSPSPEYPFVHLHTSTPHIYLWHMTIPSTVTGNQADLLVFPEMLALSAACPLAFKAPAHRRMAYQPDFIRHLSLVTSSHQSIPSLGVIEMKITLRFNQKLVFHSFSKRLVHVVSHSCSSKPSAHCANIYWVLIPCQMPH